MRSQSSATTHAQPSLPLPKVRPPLSPALEAARARLAADGYSVPPGALVEAIAAALRAVAADPLCPVPKALHAIAGAMTASPTLPPLDLPASINGEWFHLETIGRMNLPGIGREGKTIERAARIAGVLAPELRDKLWRLSRPDRGSLMLHRTALDRIRRRPAGAGGWFTMGELMKINLAALPTKRSSATHWAEREGWREPAREGTTWRAVPGSGPNGVMFEYHASILPEAAQRELIRRGLWDGAPPWGE